MKKLIRCHRFNIVRFALFCGIWQIPLAVFGARCVEDDAVPLNEIRIKRVKSAEAVHKADFTNMTLSLKIAVAHGGADERESYLVKLVRLDPIYDDTGKLLLTKERFESIESMGKSVKVSEVSGFGGKRGPVVSFVLDAPVRRSQRLKKISGKIEVTKSTEKTFTIEKLGEKVGTEVGNMEWDGLKIFPQISKPDEDGISEVTLLVEGNHRRITDWKLVQSKRPLRIFSVSRSKKQIQKVQEVHSLQRSFVGHDPTKDTTMLLRIAGVGKKDEFDFSFENVILP